MTEYATAVELLHSSLEDERLMGLRQIRNLDPAVGMKWLFHALGDESWRVRKEAVEIFLGLPRASQLAGEVVEFLHAQENAGLRNTAAEILVRLGRHAVPFLLEELTCNDRDVRKFALDVLGEIGDRSAVAPMLAALRDPDDNVRAAAAENLGRMRTVEAVESLVNALESDGDLLLRFTILEALGRIGAPVPTRQLLPFGDDPLLRKPLFDCLGQVGGPECTPLLLAGSLDQVRNIRNAALLALARLCARFPEEMAVSLAGAPDARIAEHAAELLDSPEAEARLAGIKVLGLVRDGRLAPRLLDLLTDEEFQDAAAASLIAMGRAALCSLTGIWPQADVRRRSFIAYFFGESGCTDGEDLLLDGLSAAEPMLQMACCRSLGRLGSQQYLGPLAACLTHAGAEVQEEAALAIARIGSRFPQAALQIASRFLEEEEPLIRAHAVQILSRLPGVPVGPYLTAALKDDSPMVRRAAVGALEARGGEEHLSVLVLALTDEDPEVRRLAAEALGSTGSEGAVRPLELAMADEDIWVRTAAVRSLGRIDDPRACELIRGGVEDPVGLVTIAALETLSVLDFSAAYPLLQKALDHADEEVVNAALQQLMRGDRSEWIQSSGRKLLNHRNWEVRITSARTLAALQGVHCRSLLEERLLVEGEDLVRSCLGELLTSLPPVRG